MWAAIANENSIFHDVNGVSVIKIDFCLVVNCCVSCIGKFATAEKGLVEGWYDVNHVGWCPHIEAEFQEFGCHSHTSYAEDKNLVDRVVLSSKVSWSAHVVEAASVSLTADAMVSFMIPCLRAMVDMVGPVDL